MVEYPKGTPENHVSFAEVIARLHRGLSFTAGPLERGRVKAAVELVARLEAVEDVRALVGLFTRDARAELG